MEPVTTNATQPQAPTTNQVTPPPAENTQPKEDPNYAARFAELSKRERSLYQLEKDLKAQQQQVQAHLEEVNKFKSVKEKAKLNPHAYLEEAGLKFDDLTSFYLNDQKPTPESKIDMLYKEIEGLKKSLDEKEQGINKRFEEEQKVKEQQIIDGYKSQIKSHIESKKDKYEILGSMKNNVDYLYNLVQEAFKSSGQIPDLDKVCEAAENQAYEELTPYFKLSKFSQALQAKNDKSDSQTSTLTNSNTINQPMPNSNKSLSEEEAWNEAQRILRASFIKE